MGFADNLLAPFNTDAQTKAAQDQIAAIQRGQTQGSAALGQGRQDIQNTYAAGLQPLQQANAGATQGTDQLAKLLGLGGGDPASVLAALRGTPGYQFTLGQGTENVDRNRAATGALNSGGTDTAIADYTTGLADKTYQSAVQNLLPYLQQRGQTAGQIGALSGQEAGLLAGNQKDLASLLYGSNVGQGNAQASADLAPLQAGKNIWDTGTKVANLAAGLYGGIPGGGGGGQAMPASPQDWQRYPGNAYAS